jgi:lipid A 3-O-deacylase
MKKGLIIGLLFLGQVSLGGFFLTIENDVFRGSDDDYSNGIEMEYVEGGDSYGVYPGQPFQRGYGISQIMYTPMDISIATNQPSDREWCGTMDVFYETLKVDRKEIVRQRWQIGVLGPSAKSEDTQTWFHEVIGSDKPQGWSNQMPDEPMLNYYHERHHPVWLIGDEDGWQLKTEAIYGGTIGTTFIDIQGGHAVMTGWNIPPIHIPGGINPKVMKTTDFYGYVLGEMGGLIVIHNATIGESFIRDRDQGQEQDLERLVGMARYGIVGGYKALSVSYLIGMKTAEYEGQPKNTDWGMVKIGIGSEF